MSFLRALDATSIASRQSAALADPSAWAMSGPRPPRRAPLPRDAGQFSWWALTRNPKAALVSAMVATMVAGDVLTRARDSVVAR